MKTVRFKPNLVVVPGKKTEFEFDNSIVIIEGDTEYLIGDDANRLGDSGQRIIGGTIRERHYQRLTKALLAMGLGAGEFELSVGFSASSDQMDKFRANSSNNILSDADFDLLAEQVKEIKFRVGRTNAPIQVCRVKLSKNVVPVLYETEAVRNVIPKKAKTYAIFQVGGGDWQSMLVVDGEICLNTHTRVGGMNNCVAKMAKELGLTHNTAEKAWLTGEKPGSRDGINSGWVSCIEDKKQIARAFVIPQVATLLNSFEGRKDRINAVIVSGGAVHDKVFIETLTEELPENITLYTLDQFEIMEPNGEKLLDPNFACAFGIHASGVDVGLDIGNAYLKGVFDV